MYIGYLLFDLSKNNKKIKLLDLIFTKSEFRSFYKVLKTLPK